MKGTAVYDLLYLFDAYCGWCYGLAPALRELDADNGVTITVAHGSLFSGEASGPIGSYTHIPGANQRITALTGVQFGPRYQDLLEEGTFVLDSDAAARGLGVLKHLAGRGRHVEMAHAVQRAFYQEGHDLSDPDTYVMIAEAHDLHGEAARTLLASPQAVELAEADQRLADELGVHSYPTLLASTPHGLVKIGSPVSSADQLRQILAALPD